MKNKKYKSGLIVLIVILVLGIGLSCISVFKPGIFSFEKFNLPVTTTVKTTSSKKGVTVEKHKGKTYIATIYITGTIEDANSTYNQKWLMETIRTLEFDENNVGIALFINSPGGGVYQSDEVYLALQEYKTTGKKLYAYMGSMAASGGYYISCAAEKIYANRNTLTGSIGVIAGQSYDLTGLFEKMGIKSETIHAGKNKNMGNYNEPLSDEQREILQSVADECYDQFVGIVANSRHMSIEEVEKLADGRVYTAKQALGNGLIDSIDSFSNMLQMLKEVTTGDETTIKEYKYEKKLSSFEMLMGAASKLSNTKAAANLGLPERVVNDINNFSAYPAYLCN